MKLELTENAIIFNPMIPVQEKEKTESAKKKAMLIFSILDDVRNFRQILISKNVGTLIEMKILFAGDSESTHVDIKLG